MTAALAFPRNSGSTEAKMKSFRERLATDQILVADGATGTNLQRLGLAGRTHTEDWLLEHPERIFDLARSFVDAAGYHPHVLFWRHVNSYAGIKIRR